MGLTRYLFSRILHGMKTPAQIIDYIGHDRVRVALAVGADRIRLARVADKLPASWYDCLEHLAGRPLDRGVFSFKGDPAKIEVQP